MPPKQTTVLGIRWMCPELESQSRTARVRVGGPTYTYADVLKVILSRAARSARLTTHFDLDFPKVPITEPYECHKHRRVCRPTNDALGFLRRYSLDTLKRIKAFDKLQRPAFAAIIHGDARTVDFPECDLVITSPPYVGLIDYHEQHRYAYELLGLNGNREDEIGASWKGNSQKAVLTYLDGMADALANVSKALCPGGRMVVIVHDRRDLYAELGMRLGFQTELRLRRHVNRRTGRRSGDFFEDVLVWRRPEVAHL